MFNRRVSFGTGDPRSPRRRYSYAASLALHATAVLLLVGAAAIQGPRVLPIKINPQTPEPPKVQRVYLQAPAPPSGKPGEEAALVYRRRARALAAAAAEKAKVMKNAAVFTKMMVQNWGFQGFYKYDFAIQQTGEVPVVTAAELPPRYEAYVIIEITIGTDGKVLEARMENDMAPPHIKQRLLSAIREWTYIPAKRDGIPIPSQRDLVVHIPT